MGVGGLVSPTLGLLGALIFEKDKENGKKLAWASLTFLEVSVICLFAGCMGNVRNIRNRGEKALVTLNGVMVGVAWGLPGVTFLMARDDEEWLGWVLVSFGVFWALVFGPLSGQAALMWSNHEEKELSAAVRNMFKSLSSVFPPMLYLAVSPLTCIWKWDPNNPKEEEDEGKGIYEICGNPLVPAWLVNLLICMAWWMRYWVGPLMKDLKSKSLVDVMLLRFAKIEGLEFGFLLLISVLGWLLFAFQDNDGEKMDLGLNVLSVLFLSFFLTLACIVIFDVLKPFLFPGAGVGVVGVGGGCGRSTTSNPTASTSNANDDGFFEDVTGALGGGPFASGDPLEASN